MAECFSAAIMRTARTSAVVMNISMNTACAGFMPGDRDVLDAASGSYSYAMRAKNVHRL